MSAPTSLRPDLDGTSCAVTDCLDVADTIATAVVGLPVQVGAPDDEATLGIPLCIEHAHLLRMGVTACRLHTHLA